MLETTATILFVIVISMVALWFCALNWLFKRMQRDHDQAYKLIGSPTLFWNNSLRNNWLFAKFLFGHGSRSIDDASIVSMSSACKSLARLL